MKWVCLDANVILKLLVFEADSHLARHLWLRCLELDVDVVAPLLLSYEVLSTLRQKTRRGLLLPPLAEEAAAALAELPLLYLHDEKLTQQAFQLAVELNQPTIYDTLYLAVAEAFGCQLWTADAAFHTSVTSRTPTVRLLADFEGMPADAVP